MISITVLTLASTLVPAMENCDVYTLGHGSPCNVFGNIPCGDGFVSMQDAGLGDCLCDFGQGDANFGAVDCSCDSPTSDDDSMVDGFTLQLAEAIALVLEAQPGRGRGVCAPGLSGETWIDIKRGDLTNVTLTDLVRAAAALDLSLGLSIRDPHRAGGVR